MIKRAANAPETEPEQGNYEKPSEREHLFQVVDIFDNTYKDNAFNLDIDTVSVKLEVVGGDENGRGVLKRLTLDSNNKAFFVTRFFLKVIGLTHKGQFEIDTEEWIGRQFYATVKHNKDKKDPSKSYANIDQFNFEKMVEQKYSIKHEAKSSDEIEWDADLK